ncbi:MAG: 4-alpha-glucanotransferase [Waltera sp.]
MKSKEYKRYERNARKQGILSPVSSIPSAYGIGTFGRESYRFVDFLEKSGNRLWQILPLDLLDTETLLISRFPFLREPLLYRSGSF